MTLLSILSKDPNIELRNRFREKADHVDTLVLLKNSGIVEVAYDELFEEAKVGKSTPIIIRDGIEVGSWVPVYINHHSTLLHWTSAKGEKGFWTRVLDACLTVTVVKGTLRLYWLDGYAVIRRGQGMKIPAGVKFNTGWDEDIHTSCLYTRRSHCGCGSDCNESMITEIGPIPV